MRCEDVERILSDDKGDLKAVSMHLQNCRACMLKYGDDLNLEMELRRLAAETAAIDISAELRQGLYPKYKAIRRLGYIQRWVWITVAFFAAIIIVFATPLLLTWLEKAYFYALAGLDNLPAIESIGLADLNRIAEYLKASGYLEYIIIALGLILATIALHLFREFKEIVR